MSDRHLAAAGSREAAVTARRLLQCGGNAYDAAVGATFAAMLSEPALTGPAGGGQLMAHTSSGQSCLYDFFVDTPRRRTPANLDFFPVTVDFGTAYQQFHIGRGSVAVPGTAAGLVKIQAELGRLPLSDVVEPGVRFAVEGVPLAPLQADMLRLLEPILTHDPAAARLFAPGGRLVRAGESFRNPALAETLQAMTKQGAGLFYGGEIGQRLCRWEQEGGLVGSADLAAYQVEKRKPLRAVYAGCELLLTPPPATNGTAIAQILGRLSGRADHELVDLIAETAPLRPRRRRPSGGSTTHISVLDRDGNAASVTTTNGEGCGYLLPETGIMPNNMLGEEELNPGGFHRGRRGERMATAIAPTIVLRHGEPVLLTGSAGSERIRSALLQVIFRHLHKGLSIREATAAPRAHLEESTLHVEPGLDAEKLLAGLDAGFEVRPWPGPSVFFGGANSVTAGEASSDERRQGCALVISPGG